MHKNLSNEINKNLVESEQLGGFYVNELSPAEIIKARTRNSIYTIRRGPESHEIKSEPVTSSTAKRTVSHFPDWTPCVVHGSTWGGSMLKIGFVGLGMRLEFSTADMRGAIITSTIQEIAKGFED